MYAHQCVCACVFRGPLQNKRKEGKKQEGQEQRKESLYCGEGVKNRCHYFGLVDSST